MSVDKELVGRAVGVVRSRHGDRAVVVAQALARLVGNRRAEVGVRGREGGLVAGGRLLKPTALDHIAGDHAVKGFAGVMACVHVGFRARA